MARPTKLTPELHDKIVTAVAAGNYMETAAAFAGIRKDTLYRWLRRGARERSGMFHAFSDAIEKALAHAEQRDVAIINKAADGYDVVKVREMVDAKGQVVSRTEERSREFVWQAAAWRLERKFPHKWGRRDRLEHTGSVDQVHRGAVLVVGGDESAYVAALRRARGAPIVDDVSPNGASDPIVN